MFLPPALMSRCSSVEGCSFFSLHRGIILMSRIAGVCLMDSWCFSSGCPWCCRYIHYSQVYLPLSLPFESHSPPWNEAPWLLLLANLFPFVSGVWNSQARGSDVSVGNAEDPTGAYYDPGLQDLLPLRASSLSHHKYFEVQEQLWKKFPFIVVF